MDEFEKKFKEISTSYAPNKAWDEWLDYCIDINLFTTHNQNLDFKGREKDYYDLFEIWLKLMYKEVREDSHQTGVTGWSDYLGVFYESHVKTKYHAQARGQFFTPPHICDVMAEINMGDDVNYKDHFLLDACCGSGRFILAGHSKEPEIIGLGIDLDPIACKMAVLNLYIHGCRGSIINGNSLSNEFIQGWKVNQYLGKGLPVPHIELINGYDEALYFFGRNPEKIVDIKDKKVAVNNTKSVQSTLI